MKILHIAMVSAVFFLVAAPGTLAQEANGDCENCYECQIGWSVTAACQKSSSAPYAQQEGCTIKVKNASDCRTHFTSCRGTDNSCLPGDDGPAEEGGLRIVLDPGDIETMEPNWFTPVEEAL